MHAWHWRHGRHSCTTHTHHQTVPSTDSRRPQAQSAWHAHAGAYTHTTHTASSSWQAHLLLFWLACCHAALPCGHRTHHPGGVWAGVCN
jgi:hypothetical protein